VALVVVGLALVEGALEVAAVGEDAGALALGKASRPRSAVVGLVVADQVGLVLIAIVAIVEIESLI
jgi:ActR/RegA family two-component response regulator